MALLPSHILNDSEIRYVGEDPFDGILDWLSAETAYAGVMQAFHAVRWHQPCRRYSEWRRCRKYRENVQARRCAIDSESIDVWVAAEIRTAWRDLVVYNSVPGFGKGENPFRWDRRVVWRSNAHLVANEIMSRLPDLNELQLLFAPERVCIVLDSFAHRLATLAADPRVKRTPTTYSGPDEVTIHHIASGMHARFTRPCGSRVEVTLPA